MTEEINEIREIKKIKKVKEKSQTEYETGENRIQSNELDNNANDKDDGDYLRGIEPLSLKAIAYIVYLCQALSFLFGITAFVGVIIDYLRFDEAKNTWLESHLIWQIRTFWIGLGVAAVGCFFVFISIGFLILAADLVWLIYRVIKGWMLLHEGRPIANYKALL